ncbi:GNAT family N-acetyltransferase [Paenibacillus swuensis]|uniref:GNAT family N-acetyltransferase n=1 Tax=Paenibacillus swuensis TaxID=1178515 RepID=UPI000837E71E|nr:GNAT family N-acetyltransferase [Paenibacillus swuensis]
MRALQLPGDYEEIAGLLNQIWSEPTTAERLLEEDQKLYEVGHTWLNDEGLLVGYDRERQVAVDENGMLVGFARSWRAPWTEPGYLNNTVVVDRAVRQKGVGQLLLTHVVKWANSVGADSLLAEVWDDDADALRFAEKRGFAVERHMFQSVLNLDVSEPVTPISAVDEIPGIRWLTLADELGEESERKLYQLSAETMKDIPGFMGSAPDFAEWCKWYLKCDGFAPERVLIAADGDRYVGMANLALNMQTKGIYNEYTCVDRITGTGALPWH